MGRKALQVKRNEDKFPDGFRFGLSIEEYQNLPSQNVTANWDEYRRTETWAFTESGLYIENV